MTPNRGRKEGSTGRAGEVVRLVSGGGRDLVRLLAGAVGEIGKAVVAIGRLLGRFEQRAGPYVSGPLRASVRAVRTAVGAAERAVTPTRAIGSVVLAAAILLGVSQFVDYRAVGIGTNLYEGVEGVAPPPLTARKEAGSAHSYLLIPVAALAIVALPFALRGRWQLGRAVALLGAVAIAVTLVVDMPQGLDEGQAAREFEGAEATLLEGFWAELSSGAVLVVAGILLGRYVRLGLQPANGGSRRSRAVARRRRGASSADAGARA